MLITLEGIDGSGKTTVWEALRDALGDGYTFTREPTNSWYGDAVRRSIETDDSLRNRVGPRSASGKGRPPLERSYPDRTAFLPGSHTMGYGTRRPV